MTEFPKPLEAEIEIEIEETIEDPDLLLDPLAEKADGPAEDFLAAAEDHFESVLVKELAELDSVEISATVEEADTDE